MDKETSLTYYGGMLTLPSRAPLPQPDFLPTSRAEMDRLGWKELDVPLII